MTISLEQLHDNSPADRNFHKLAQLVLDTGGKTIGIRFGTGSVTFTASTTSATQTIAHGLAKVPQYIACQALDSSGAITVRPVSGADAVNFQAVGRTASAVTGAATFYWAVIG